MTGTNHGLTGAVIALLVKEPVLAVPLSFLSHFACDGIPHYGIGPQRKLFDNKFNIALITDFVVAVGSMVVLAILFPAQKWLIWGCMIAAASPDLMWAYYYGYIQKIKNKKPHMGVVARIHTWIQWSETPRGWLVESVWFVMMSVIIFAQR